MRPRSIRTVTAAILVAACSIAAGNGSAASSGSVVGANVLSATSLDVTGCAPGVVDVTEIGTVTVGTSNVTGSDCAVAFGSSNNATAQLRVAQSDAIDQAMWSYSTGKLDPAYDGPGGTGDGAFPVPIGSASDAPYHAAQYPDGRIVAGGTCAVGATNRMCFVRLLRDGSLDPTFDGPGLPGNGKFTVSVTGNGDEFYRIALQPDGKIVVAGFCFNGADDDFCVLRMNDNGTWDTTFDGPSGTGNGRFTLSVGPIGDYPYSMVLQDDGKIVLAGGCRGTTNQDICLARLMPDGSYDATFDGPGVPGNGVFIYERASGNDRLYDVAILPDGRIVAVGYCHNGSNEDFCFARFNANGSFDMTFDGPGVAGNGLFLTAIGTGNDHAEQLLLQPDGKLVVAGTCAVGAQNDGCFVRLNANGSWDTTFDGPSGSGNGRFTLAVGAGNDNLVSIASQLDGKYLSTGLCANGGGNSMCIVRLTNTGALDDTFDGPTGSGNGVVMLDPTSGDARGRMVRTGIDGRIVVLGWCDNPTRDFCFVQLDSNGRVDDYVTGGGSDTDWSSDPDTTTTFGACLASTSGGASAQWVVGGACAPSDGATWNAIGTTPSMIAYTTAIEPDPADATANLRFGLRVSNFLRAGSYMAPITFDVIAP